MDYNMGMKKDKKKKMTPKSNKRMGMMYGGRKSMMHGGPHNNMDRIKMNMGGAMEVAESN
jgi:hypothetical protein